MRRAEFYKRIFDEILRLSDDGFIVVDNHAIVTDINELYSKFLGKPREEIIGKPITNVIPNSKMPDIMKNQYREDLYYRLNVINISLPPLRERREDIPLLVGYYMDKLNQEYKRNVAISKDVMHALCVYSWGGNVRELDNVIKGAYAVCDGLEILMSDLPVKMESAHKKHVETAVQKRVLQTTDPDEMINLIHEIGSMKAYLETVEKAMILSAYEKFHSVRKAAEYLGMSMPTYVRKRQAYLNAEQKEEGRTDS
ncbi:MAG: PAS domain-containing protein [Eubacteriales bacterium]|nr:PAS domain-containing protein [Eubacteriales bacterium]